MFPADMPVLSALLVLSLVLALLLVLVMLRLRGLALRVAALSGDPRILERLATVERSLTGTGQQIERLGTRLNQTTEQTDRCLQKVGLVRYDAFQELGGHLSFSVALLDAKRDGVVLSVLNDRAGARAYAKPITGGQSPFTLSQEEQQAIAQT
jgi:hypothetical protein